MGKIILKKGDLFDTTRPIIGHGVNCSNGFGSGIAKQIAYLYPEVKGAYHEKFHRFGWKLGDCQVVELRGRDPIRQIANLGTQQFYGREPGRVYVDYDAVFKSVSTLLDYADDLGWGVAIPRIGCGLGGGDWGVISNLLMEAMTGRTINLEVWSP